jgi:hypothetical protein
VCFDARTGEPLEIDVLVRRSRGDYFREIWHANKNVPLTSEQISIVQAARDALAAEQMHSLQEKVMTDTKTPASRVSTPIAEFMANIAQLNNGAMMEVADFMRAQSPAYRARVIERCAAIIGAIAETDA